MHTTKNPLHQEKLTMHDNGIQIPIPEELESPGTDPKELDPSDTDSQGFSCKVPKKRTIKGKTQKRIEINVLKPN